MGARGASAWDRGFVFFFVHFCSIVSMGPPVARSGHAVDVFRVGGELDLPAAMSLYKVMRFCLVYGVSVFLMLQCINE